MGDKWELVALPAEIAAYREVTAMPAAPDGSIWAAVSGQPEQVALLHLQGGRIEVIKPGHKTFALARVRDMLITPQGDLYFGSDVGLSCRDSAGQWRSYNMNNSGLIHNTVLGLAQGGAGAIWMATAGGVSRYLRNYRS